jgi:hypothetical protein
MPPGVLLDNIPNWEFGVLVQVRDLTRVMRNDFSRSQTQSVEDKDLAEAEPSFNFDNNRWILPSTESRYRQGIRRLESYQARLLDEAEPDANFYARADNLREWLAVVEKRLGNLSQQLSASVGQVRVNTDLAGDPAADATRDRARTESRSRRRGSDRRRVLRGARHRVGAAAPAARGRVRLPPRAGGQERDREPAPGHPRTGGQPRADAQPDGAQRARLRLFANHSLVMASYLSRANQAITNLRELLAGG